LSQNPFVITEPTIISFSGGRTSAYMLWRVLEANDGKLPSEAIVCFANTGKEEEATLQFVKDCETHWNVPIVWLEYRTENPKFNVVNFDTASRNGEPFEQLIKKRKFLPNGVMRFCTSELKILPIDRFMKSIGIDDYCTMVGIRADEPRRVAKMKNNKDEKVTPLASAKVTESIVWDFWNNQSFDLQLAKTSGASNCDLCFLKGGKILQGLIKEKPERALWWAKMEKEIGGTFNKDRPNYQTLYDFNQSQMQLFDDESIPCFCGD
jgi:3'-phosphoadenosine 5'-phosphosulfate sulfotransferase (PAPS reductase)/FAD synthetase